MHPYPEDKKYVQELNVGPWAETMIRRIDIQLRRGNFELAHRLLIGLAQKGLNHHAGTPLESATAETYLAEVLPEEIVNRLERRGYKKIGELRGLAHVTVMKWNGFGKIAADQIMKIKEAVVPDDSILLS